MRSRAEVTTRYAKAYVSATKKQRGQILDEVVAVTGWSRDNARRRLRAAATSPPGPGCQVAVRTRRPRASKYSYEATRILAKVWAASGGQCGKYLAASMLIQLDALERHGELALTAPAQLDPEGRYSPAVRGELLGMSAATIDRYLAPARARDQVRGVATTKPSPLLRSTITIRRAGDEVEAEPGFFEADTVAHCGPSLKGEFARTLNLTCVHTGWVFTTTVRNNAHAHILGALSAGVQTIPFQVSGLDFDNGSEFGNHAVIDWAADRQIFFTRSRPYKKNDQATIESKNNHLVRRYAFYYRYDTAEERAVLGRLWPLVNDRLNYLTPTKKPTGYGTDRHGHRTRTYDKPTTPLQRLLAADVLSPAQQADLLAYRDSLNPADLARRIGDLQTRLLVLAKEKTEQIYLASFPSALPHVHRGIRIQAS
ncbi:integrase catalytic domain-containing protein [Ornithinimicrobium sp. W1679]|uniref:integrase catalytic domain-containing protein n=1 Tax=Ornithinimicrobium sp. W1679 TaxID=3418770 RepID=UPI003CE94988